MSQTKAILSLSTPKLSQPLQICTSRWQEETPTKGLESQKCCSYTQIDFAHFVRGHACERRISVESLPNGACFDWNLYPDLLITGSFSKDRVFCCGKAEPRKLVVGAKLQMVFFGVQTVSLNV